MAKMIRIQSTTTITVTSGLQLKDVTNPDAHIPDRLKVSALWPRATVDIKAGIGYYPVEIAEWPSVKALEKDGIFTLGEIVESEATADIEKVETLNRKMKSIKKEATSLKKLVEDKE